MGRGTGNSPRQVLLTGKPVLDQRGLLFPASLLQFNPRSDTFWEEFRESVSSEDIVTRRVDLLRKDFEPVYRKLRSSSVLDKAQIETNKQQFLAGLIQSAKKYINKGTPVLFEKPVLESFSARSYIESEIKTNGLDNIAEKVIPNYIDLVQTGSPVITASEIINPIVSALVQRPNMNRGKPGYYSFILRAREELPIDYYRECFTLLLSKGSPASRNKLLKHLGDTLSAAEANIRKDLTTALQNGEFDAKTLETSYQKRTRDFVEFLFMFAISKDNRKYINTDSEALLERARKKGRGYNRTDSSVILKRWDDIFDSEDYREFLIKNKHSVNAVPDDKILGIAQAMSAVFIEENRTSDQPTSERTAEFVMNALASHRF